MLSSDHEQAEILERILTIGQAVQKHIHENPKIVYELIVETVCETTGADCAVLYPYHPSFGEFYDVDNVAACGLHHELPVEPRADQRRRLAARVHREGEVVREDIEKEEPHLPSESPLITREEIRAFMGLSLRVGKDYLGILYVDYREPHSFSEEERQIIRLLGYQAAIAISNSWTSRLADLRSDALSKLKMVGQSLVAIEDPAKSLDDLLEGIAHHALDVLDADMVDIYQYVQISDEYIMPPTLVGRRWFPEVPKTEIYEDDVIMTAIKIGEPQYFHDSQGTASLTGKYEVPREDAPDQQFVVREGIGSSAIIPLIAANETVGVMFVNYRNRQLFGPEQKDVIESFAAQAAIAVHNNRMFNETLRQRNELEVVDEVGKLLMATLDLREIPRLLLQRIIRLFGVAGASLWGVDHANRRVNFLFALDRTGAEEPYSDAIREMTFQLGDGIVGMVAESGEPIVDNDVQANPNWDKRVDAATSFETKSILAVPLTYKQETIGVVEILNPLSEVPFTEEDRDFLVSVVSPAAIALENARLFYEVNQSLERRVEALTVLNEIGQTLTSGIRLREDEILELIYEQTRKLTGTQDMYIALYDEATNMIRFGLALVRGQRVAYEPREADMDKRGKTEEIIFTRQPILHRTIREAEDWYGQPGHQEFVDLIQPSWLGVPMILGEKVLGVIAVYDVELEGAYDEHDLQALLSMASQAAIALDNANLYYEINQALTEANQALERRVQALSVLNDVGQTLTSGIRLKENGILNSIYEQACRLTGTQNIYIAQYDEQTEMITFKLLMEKGEPLDVEQQKGFAPRKINRAELGKTEEVVLTRKPILHKTRAEALAWYQEPGHREYVGEVSASHLAVPMMIGERVMGVLAIYDWGREGTYDEQDLQVLSSMASQAAIALENARLYAAAREELIAARQLAALGTVTAAIQHRINNTLNIIGPNLTRLRRRVDTSDATIQEILDIIERNTKYTSDYINRIQEPLKETEDQFVDINLSLREAQAQVLEQYQDRAGFGKVEVVYDIDDSLPPIEASLGQINEVFRNLIENSYKAMAGDGGRLTITNRLSDDWLEVEIRDTGHGIPPNIRDRLLEKPVPSREPGAGSGLGLWLTNLLLQKYAGEIALQETGPNGTTMLVRLPIASPKWL